MLTISSVSLTQLTKKFLLSLRREEKKKAFKRRFRHFSVVEALLRSSQKSRCSRVSFLSRLNSSFSTFPPKFTEFSSLLRFRRWIPSEAREEAGFWWKLSSIIYILKIKQKRQRFVSAASAFNGSVGVGFPERDHGVLREEEEIQVSDAAHPGGAHRRAVRQRGPVLQAAAARRRLRRHFFQVKPNKNTPKY